MRRQLPVVDRNGPAARGASCARRGLSLIEMMIALTISVTLLTATLAALDAMFKGYKQTTESASTHLISRIVVSRVLGMIRTGEGFGPTPLSVLDRGENPLSSDFVQFVSARDGAGTATELVRIEYRYEADFAENTPGVQNPPLRDWGMAGGPPDDLWPEVAGELWFVRLDLTTDPPTVLQENPLLSGVRSVVFTLHYDRGPQLTHAAMDLVVEPNDSRDLTIGAESTAQTFRLVGSAAPRTGVRTE